MATKDEMTEYRKLVKLRERQSRGLEKKRTLARLRGPVQVYLSQKGYTDHVSARLDNADLESETVPDGLDIDTKDWPDAKLLIRALKNKDYSGFWSDNTSSDEEEKEVSHVTNERKSRPESFRANPERKTGFESLSNAKFLRPREKVSTNNIRVDELDDLDLYVSRRLRYKKVQNSNEKDSKSPHASTGIELRRTSARINCSALCSQDDPKAKAWQEPVSLTGKSNIMENKVCRGELNTRMEAKRFMGVSHGDLQDTRREIADWSRRETDPDLEYLAKLGKPVDVRNHVERIMEKQKPETDAMSFCRKIADDGRLMLLGCDGTDLLLDKPLAPSPTHYCPVFPLGKQSYGGSVEKPWSPEPLRNETSVELPEPVSVKVDPHVHVHCSLEDGGYQPSFHSVNSDKKPAKKQADTPCTRPLPTSNLLQAHGVQVPRTLTVPSVPCVIPRKSLSTVNQASTGQNLPTTQSLRQPKTQPTQGAQHPTANSMGGYRQAGDKTNPLFRAEAVNTGGEVERIKKERPGLDQRQERSRAVCSLAQLNNEFRPTGPRSTTGKFPQMGRGRACLKPTLAANFTCHLPQPDPSLTRKQPGIGPNTMRGSREIRPARCGEQSQQTTSRVDPSETGNDVNSEVSREPSSTQIGSDTVRSPEGGRDQIQRKSVRERLVSYVRRRWDQLQQSAKRLNCAAEP